MRQGPLVAGIGVLVFAAVAIATLPASLLVSRLPADLVVEGASGSIWNGAADGVRLRGAPIGALTWVAEPLALVRGELAFHIEVTRPDGFVRGRIAASLGGTVEGRAIELKLPITALHPQSPEQDWRGGLAGTIAEVRLDHGWPVALSGAFQITGLQPPASHLVVGDFALDFDGRNEAPGQLRGRIRDTASPLVVRAELVIHRERSYEVRGEVVPRPDAPVEISRAVAFLGAADAAGRRSFEITGTF